MNFPYPQVGYPQQPMSPNYAQGYNDPALHLASLNSFNSNPNLYNQPNGFNLNSPHFNNPNQGLISFNNHIQNQ